MRIKNILVGLCITAYTLGLLSDDKKVNAGGLESKVEVAMSVENSAENLRIVDTSQDNPIYQVQRGEDLHHIASHYGIKVEKLLELNPNLIEDVHTGQFIVIPSIDSISERFPRLIKYKDDINRVAERYGLEPRLVYSVIQQESNGNPNAVSPKGAIGLGQIMPDTGRMYGIRNPTELYNPKTNINVTARHLVYLMDKFDGNMEQVLAAYNGGDGRVERLLAKRSSDWKNFLPSETKEYIPAVMNYYN